MADMLHLLKQRLRSEKGFTLIELIVVVAILGILAAVLTPRVLGALDNAKGKSASTSAKQIQVAMERYNGDNNRYPLAENITSSTTLSDQLASYIAVNVGNITFGSYTSSGTGATATFSLTITFIDSGKQAVITPTGITVT